MHQELTLIFQMEFRTGKRMMALIPLATETKEVIIRRDINTKTDRLRHHLMFPSHDCNALESLEIVASLLIRVLGEVDFRLSLQNRDHPFDYNSFVTQPQIAFPTRWIACLLRI